MRIGLILVSLLFALSAPLLRAQTSDEVSLAQEAARALEQAAQDLADAKKARDRVKALTRTITAYEEGLGALRQGIRRASVREKQISQSLAAKETEVTRLLAVLISMGKEPPQTHVLHPQGAVGTARSGMILSDVMPAMQAKLDTLKAELEELQSLQALQTEAMELLRAGLEDTQIARTELSQAIAQRTDLPRRFIKDDSKVAILIAATETLDAFASGLSTIAVDESQISLPDISELKGRLAMPVRGTVLRDFGAPDAAGIKRPGIIVAARPHAIVTTPVAATLRYHGDLLDYGIVSILEPQAGLLFVFAGLDVAYGDIGQVLPAGFPIGQLPASSSQTGESLKQVQQGTGILQSQTLYIEVRKDNTPVDPRAWFQSTRE